MRVHLPLLAALVAALTAPAAAANGSATVTGTVDGPAIVWVSDGSRPAPLDGALMRQSKKTFVPDALVVTAGSTVVFPNDDEFYHNVFSDGASTPFDLGLYDVGPGKTVLFDRPGVAEVRCHIHAAMHATIVVVDGPWQRLDRAGTYALAVRRGRHTLHVWTPAGGERRSTAG